MLTWCCKTTGFIGNKYAWPALTNIGQADLALEIALSTTSPSYGYQIVNGATTLWEDWSGADIMDTLPEKAQGVRVANCFQTVCLYVARPMDAQ